MTAGRVLNEEREENRKSKVIRGAKNFLNNAGCVELAGLNQKRHLFRSCLEFYGGNLEFAF